ncbi:MAG: hypothetical protein NVS2B12_25300 [Ktedonobacteraceae bacterium]
MDEKKKLAWSPCTFGKDSITEEEKKPTNYAGSPLMNIAHLFSRKLTNHRLAPSFSV